MSGDFELEALFETGGRFVGDGANQTEIVGRLVSTADEIVLEQAPSMMPPSSAFAGGFRTSSTLQGVTLEGNCTLFDAFEQPGPRVFLGTGDILTNSTHHISTAVMGLHLQSRLDPVITGATFYYAGLEEMLPRAFSVRHDPAAKTIAVEYQMTRSTLFDRTVSLIGRIALKIGANVKYRHLDATVAGRAFVTVEPSEPKSTMWFLDVASRIENFWSLIFGTSTSLTKMLLHTDQGTGSLIERRTTRVEKLRREAWFQCTPEQLADAMERWLSLPEELRPIDGLIYNTIRKSSFFVETEFLLSRKQLNLFTG